MAVDFKVKGEGGTRGSEYRYYPEQLIVKAELNGRHELPDISWLIADIVARSVAGTTGQLEPVTIRKGPKDEPILVAGFSRWRAISEINKKKLLGEPIPLRCVYTKMTEVQAFLANISENRFRNPTTRLDDAHNIVRLRDVYMKTDEDIARIYYPNFDEASSKECISWIRKTSKLASITPDMEVAIKAGRVKESAVAGIAKLSEEQQNELAAAGGAIDGKAIKATKPPKAEKPQKVQVSDKELLRLAKAILEDISGVLSDETADYIEVDRKLLLALFNHIEPKK